LPKFDLIDGLHPNISNLFKGFYFHPNLNEAFSHLLRFKDLIEAGGP